MDNDPLRHGGHPQDVPSHPIQQESVPPGFGYIQVENSPSNAVQVYFADNEDEPAFVHDERPPESPMPVDIQEDEEENFVEQNQCLLDNIFLSDEDEFGGEYVNDQPHLLDEHEPPDRNNEEDEEVEVEVEVQVEEEVVDDEEVEVEVQVEEEVVEEEEDHELLEDEFDLENDDVQYEDYRNILKDLSEDWISAEIDHRVSKVASNVFWSLAKDYFYRLYSVKFQQGITRKVPNFEHIRRQLYKKKVPKVKMAVCYQSKATGELTVLEDIESTPVSKFPPSTHKRLYEVAAVDVSIYN